MTTLPRTAEGFFADSLLGLAVLATVREDLTEAFEDVEVRTSRSQVAFRRRRGFAVLWRPGRYLANPGAEVVLSILLERRVVSPRWKEVVQPAPGRWQHHLEVYAAEDVDDEVRGWLHEAAVVAGPSAARATASR
jgi:hypothetical protein